MSNKAVIQAAKDAAGCAYDDAEGTVVERLEACLKLVRYNSFGEVDATGDGDYTEEDRDAIVAGLEAAKAQ